MTRARHWTILLLAAGLVLALASGLAACGGSADGALPPPESPAPPAATPAPAVTPVEPPATVPLPTPPEPAPEPEPEPPPATCTATTLGVDPVTNTGLGADCAALLAAKDALRGTATLNWDAATALTGWDGVTLSGAPKRVTGLDLRKRKLTGAIPAELGSLTRLRELILGSNQLTGAIPTEWGSLTRLRRLGVDNNQLTGAVPAELGALTRLTHVSLTGNTLTGCLPVIWKTVANTDFAASGLPFCSVTLAYDRYDTTGAVTTAGSYAFLTTDDAGTTSAVTTYEGLRDGSTTQLKVHQTDADDASQSTFYGLVEAGDLVEWKRAADCFVRYTVTSAPTPAAGAVTRSFGVAWMTYAFTGCSGAIATATTDVDVTWGAVLPDLGGTSLTAAHPARALAAHAGRLDGRDGG